MINRRTVLQSSLAASALACVGGFRLSAAEQKPQPYKISLAQWSLNKAFFSGELNPLEFPTIARDKFDIDGVEYVNQFFADKANDKKFLSELKSRAGDSDVKAILIMIDREGNLGDTDDAARKQAVENHHKWVEAAKFLGCHSIRVNAATTANYEEGMKLAADGLRRLSEFAKPMGINVIVENHGGLSSNGEWLAATIKMVEMDNCGTLPDFGNFGDYDRYKGVKELMPYAKGVSAKSYHFDDQGNETTIDYPKMIEIVTEAGYNGYIGIEYEGKDIAPMEGIRLTKELLVRCRENAGKGA